jgi:hypothetical protein
MEMVSEGGGNDVVVMHAALESNGDGLQECVLEKLLCAPEGRKPEREKKGGR